MLLWRPVGLQEMALVFDSEMRAFPPRLPEQPIFYPVLKSEYAVQIARDWNTRANSLAGYVLRFEVPDDYAREFEQRIVGSSVHAELWIPAERLTEFNARLSGSILPEKAFFGAGFLGHVPERFGLKGKDAYEQIKAMVATMSYSSFDFAIEIAANARAIFLNYPFWRAAGPSRLEVDARELDRCLAGMREIWSRSPRAAALIEDSLLN